MIAAGAGIITVPQERIPEFGKQLIRYYETNDMTEIKDFLKTYALERNPLPDINMSVGQPECLEDLRER